MTRYSWHPGSFVVSRINDDGSASEIKFTSQAQARQFIEVENKKALAEQVQSDVRI